MKMKSSRAESRWKRLAVVKRGSFLLGTLALVGVVTFVYFFNVASAAPTTLYSENFGTGTTFPTGWTTTASDWSVSTASPSSTYTGASGGSNVTATNSTTNTKILTYSNNLSTVGYTAITVLWGQRYSSATFTPAIAFQWSNDGTTWNTVTYSDTARDGTWALVNGGSRISLPSGAEGVSSLRFRWLFNGNSGSSNFRIDDFSVQGTLAQFRSAGSGNWNSNSTWEVSADGTTWTAATQTPTSFNDTISIQSGHTVTVTAAVTTDQTTVSSGGTLIVNDSIALSLNDGSGFDLIVAGTLNVVNSGVVNGSSATFSLSSGGTLGIGSPNGISAGPLGTGSIQTLNKNYSSGANYVYSGTSAQVTGTGLPTAGTGTLTINNSAGVTLSQATSFSNFTLTSGNLTTTSTNLLTVSGTATTAITGGSSTSYVNGPLARILPASLVTGSTYTFPVGKGSYNPFDLVNPTTNAGGTVTFKAEEFDGNSGGSAGTGLTTLNTDRYWEASITANSGNFTNTSVKLTNSSALPANARVGKSATQTGAYDSIGGTVASNTVTSDPFSSFSFFAIGTGLSSTSTTVTADDTTVDAADLVTFTATVSSGTPGTITGTVQIKSDGNDVGSPATLSASPPFQAFPATRCITVGTHTITAVYSGDSNYATSTGTMLGSETISKPNLVLVDDSFAGTSDCTDLGASGLLSAGKLIFGRNTFATIATGQAGAKPTGIVYVNAGTYTENVTVPAGQTLELQGDVVIDGSLALDGTLNVGTHTLTLNGAVSGTGTLTSGATGTVIYNQSSNGQNVLAADYGTLTFSNFNKTLASTGTIGITTSFNPGTATGHTVTGSTIEYHLPTTVSDTTVLPFTFFVHYHNLRINQLGNTVGPTGLVVDGALTLVQGTFTSASDYADVNIGTGTTLSLSAPITVSGNWDNDGTFLANTNAVTFDGAANQTIGGDNVSQFDTLNISNTGTNPNNVVSLTQHGWVSTTLHITGGVFDLNGQDLQRTGNVTVDANTTFKDLGNSGTITMSGSMTNNGTVNINAHGATCPEPDDILITSLSHFQRSWSGSGTFSLTDVTVEDQGGTAVITVHSGTAGANNGLFWFFVASCVGTNSYVWTPDNIACPGALNNDWQCPGNWNPARGTPSSSDVLIFDGSVTLGPTVLNIPSETIASLILRSNVNPVSFNANTLGGTKTLTISGGAANDLSVPSGTLLKFVGTTGLQLALTSGSTGSVGGQILFQSNAPHQLLTSGLSTVTFTGVNGFTSDSTYSATTHPFGDGTGSNNNSIIFASGSTYTHGNGLSPFGTAANSVVTFNTGSTARYLTATGFEANGRTYANLTIGDGSSAVLVTDGGSGNFSFDTLTINNTAGALSKLEFNGTVSSTVTIRGDIISNSGPGNAPDVFLTGGTGGVVFDKSAGTINLTDNSGNSRAVLLGSNATVNSTTTLTMGRVVQMGFSADKTLTVNGILNGGTTGYVIGFEAMNFTCPLGSCGTKTFHVGTSNGYSPVDEAFTVSSAGGYSQTVKAFQGQYPLIQGGGAAALGRYWSIGTPSGSGTATADLTVHYLLGDVVGDESNYKFFRNTAGAFTEIAPDVLNTTLHFATKNGVSQFSDWTLAEPVAVQEGSLSFFDGATSNVNEGNSGPTVKTVIVRRTLGSDGAVTVNYATSDGTAQDDNPASEDNDYVATSGTLSWAAGESTDKSFNVTINGDTNVEPTETINITLSSPTGGVTIGQSGHIINVVNDDVAPPACTPPSTVYVDDNWASVTPGTDPDGGGPATDFGCDSFATIQGGIDGVASGGTVIVYEGTYTQATSINLNKSLTLRGPNFAISPNGGVRVAEALITGAPSTVLRISAPGTPVTIEGFKFDSAGVVDAYDPALDITIKKNIFSNGTSGGALYFLNAPPQLTIDDNYLTNAVLADNDTVFVAGNWNGTTGTVATITNNVIENTPTDNASGMNLSNVSGTVSGNQFKKLRYYAILLANDSSSMTISGNVFDGMVNPNPTNVPTWGAGVRTFTPAFTGPVNITGNTFVNNYTGVGIRGVPNDPGATIAGMDINVNFNRFVNNTYGISDGAAGTLDAENNWWGCNYGPGTGGVGCTGTPNGILNTGSGTVDADPWIVLGVTASPNPITPGGNSTVTADMTHNSDGAVPAGVTVLPLPNASFTATNGTMSPTSNSFTAGQSQSTFTSTSGSNGSACATVDSQEICTTINVTAPSFSIDDVSHMEGDSGTTSYVFTVTKSGTTALNSSVQFQTQDVTATTANNDYTANANTLIFGPADTTMQITVLVTGDTSFEADETFNVHLLNAVDATIADADGTGTILNDDPSPNVSIDDVTQLEGSGGGTTAFVFTVTLSNPSGSAVNVNYTTTDNTAKASDSDYTTNSGVLVIPAHTASGQITVQVGADTKLEPDETFFVDLTATSVGTITDSRGIGTIQNDDAGPTFSIDDVTLAEGNAGTTNFVFTVTKTGVTGERSRVDFATANGTSNPAIGGGACGGSVDYVTQSGTLAFTPAETTKQITIAVCGDIKPEFSDTFFVNLSNAVNASITDSQGLGTITNDDTCTAPSTVYVDDSWAGTTIGEDPDGGGPATSFGCDSFDTIQGGVSGIAPVSTGVASGGTVIVYDGTYTENVTIAKAMTLKGNQFGVDARGRVAAESVVSPAVTTSPTFNVAFSGLITIDGFSFNGGPTGASGVIFTSVGPNNNMQISNNRFSNYPAAAIWMNRGGSDITIDKNELNGSNIAGSGQAMFANGPQLYHGLFITNNNIVNNTGRYGFFVDGNHNVSESATRAPLISGNLFNNNLQGMNLGSRSFGTLGAPVLGTYGGTISNNTFSNHAFDGIQGGIQHVLVSGNTFTSNTRDGIALTSFGNTGADRGGQNSVIESNTFTGQGRAGILFSGTQGVGLIETNRANFNRIVGNAVGVQYGTTAPAAGNNATIDVQNNWWGCNYGPGATGAGCSGVTNGTLVFGFGSGNSGVLDSDPWIILSTTASPNPTTPGGTSTVTADMTHNSDNAVPSGTTFVPPVAVNFTATNGAMSPTSGTITSGDETSTFTSTSTSAGSACSTVDSQETCTTINIQLPQFSINDVTQVETDAGTTNFVFTVTKTGATTFASSVQFQTADNTATIADGDYQANSGTLNFGPTDTSRQVTVLVNGDTKYELNDAFFVNLLNPVDATISDTQGVGTITNDDPVPSISINDVPLSEGNAGTTNFDFTVTISNASYLPITVSAQTADNTATTADLDYNAAGPTTLTFAANTTTPQTFQVSVNGDTKYEHNDTFFVNLSGETNSTIADGQGLGTINNDDPAPVLRFTSAPNQTEGTLPPGGTKNFDFNVHKFGETGVTATVDYATADGVVNPATGNPTPACGGSFDYQHKTASLSFAPNETDKTITIVVCRDAVYEANETFQVTLSNPVDATLDVGDETELGTIINDDSPGSSLVVNTTADHAAGSCDALPGGDCTLREAIVAANSSTSAIGISFNIPANDLQHFYYADDNVGSPGTANGTVTLANVTATTATDDTTIVGIDPDWAHSWWSIRPDFTFGPMPAITQTVVIDGYTQCPNPTQCAQTNTSSTSTNAVLRIELDGENATAGTAGLTISNGFSIVSGLAINRVFHHGIVLQSGGNDSLTGNFIGTDISGTLDLGSTGNGIQAGSSNHIIGGSTPDLANLISGNDGDGINATGISNQILGNYIGTAANGTGALPNGGSGINFSGSGTLFNSVGGPSAGKGNRIAFNALDGVRLSNSGAGNSVRGNSTYANGSTANDLGIDLGTDGVTPNDDDDPDSGPNNLQNFPVITGAMVTGSTRTITGTLNSTPSATFNIDFYQNVSCDGSGNGEGQTYIGSTPVTTDSGGDVAFTFHPPVTLTIGQYVTATATSTGAQDNTSEFSACFLVVSGAAGAGDIQFTDGTYSVNESGVTASITLTRVGGTNGSISATFTTSNGTADTSDYTDSDQTVTFLENESSKTINIPINDDAVYEGDETVLLALGTSVINGPLTNAPPTDPHAAVLTIVDNDPFSISVRDSRVAEPTSGTAQMLFTVTMQTTAASPVTVDYMTANGGATPAAGGGVCSGLTDYENASGTLTFAPGERIKTIAVNVCSEAVSPESDETFLMNISNASAGTIARPQATGTITQVNSPGVFLISELRTSGPVGAGDDFVEVYNNSTSQLTVAASDASPGYGVFKMGADCNATPVLIGTIPNGTIIPARGHFLFVGSQYSLSAYATGDLALSADIESDRNVAIFSTTDINQLSSLTRLDAVGFGTNTGGGVCDLLREGTTLPPVAGSVTEHAFLRKLCDFAGGVGCQTPGIPKDTNNNGEDLMFVDTAGTLVNGMQRLGAPGPENLASPLRRDPAINAFLLDVTQPQQSPPNRVRDFNSDSLNASPFGTMSVRRHVVNNTASTVTRLRFRIVEMTTFPSPVSEQADLRARSSGNVIVSGINDTNTCSPNPAPCSVTVEGTTLEQPPNQPATIGGGYNSTLTVNLSTPLAPGASTNVQFLLGVKQTGTFRFLIIVEALP